MMIRLCEYYTVRQRVATVVVALIEVFVGLFQVVTLGTFYVPLANQWCLQLMNWSFIEQEGKPHPTTRQAP